VLRRLRPIGEDESEPIRRVSRVKYDGIDFVVANEAELFAGSRVRSIAEREYSLGLFDHEHSIRRGQVRNVKWMLELEPRKSLFGTIRQRRVRRSNEP
jgi:hypothetical protein